MAIGFQVHKVEPTLRERTAVNSNPKGFTVHMNSDTQINFCVKTCLVV